MIIRTDSSRSLRVMLVRATAMLQNLGIDEEDNFFGNVRDVIARTFELTEHTNQVQTSQGTVGMLDDISGQHLCDFRIDFIQQIVFGKTDVARSRLSS